MSTTAVSLLERLRSPQDRDAWSRFVQIYTPFLYHWADRRNVAREDRADLIQEVFAQLLKALPEFRYDPSRSFRGWLAVVVSNKWRELNRRKRPVALPADQLDVQPGPTEDFDEQEYRFYISGRALGLIKAEFSASIWKAFWGVVVEGRPAAVVGAELGMTANAVYAARARVLRRLREELVGLID